MAWEFEEAVDDVLENHINNIVCEISEYYYSELPSLNELLHQAVIIAVDDVSSSSVGTRLKGDYDDTMHLITHLSKMQIAARKHGFEVDIDHLSRLRHDFGEFNHIRVMAVEIFLNQLIKQTPLMDGPKVDFDSFCHRLVLLVQDKDFIPHEGIFCWTYFSKLAKALNNELEKARNNPFIKQIPFYLDPSLKAERAKFLYASILASLKQLLDQRMRVHMPNLPSYHAGHSVILNPLEKAYSNRLQEMDNPYEAFWPLLNEEERTAMTDILINNIKSIADKTMTASDPLYAPVGIFCSSERFSDVVPSYGL